MWAHLLLLLLSPAALGALVIELLALALLAYLVVLVILRGLGRNRGVAEVGRGMEFR